jgi:hypothetical protein
MQVGKPNYNSRSERLVFHKLGMKDDQRTLIVRVAPPVKSLAEDGRFATYIKQHFGYGVKAGEKFSPRTFVCVERRDRNKNIVEECPECEEIALRKASLEAKLIAHGKAGMTEDEAKAAVAPLTMWLKGHNLDKKWHLLAKNQSGQWGFLTLSHKAYENFLTCIKEAQSMGIEDPLAPENGCWFKFTRTGYKFNEIADSCVMLQEATGPGQTRIKLDNLTPKDWAAIEALPDLANWGNRITYDQIKLLVSSGGADDVVKSVLDSGRKTTNNQALAEVQQVRTAPAPQEVRVEKPSSGAAGAVSAGIVSEMFTTPEPVKELSEADQLRAQLAMLQAKLASVEIPTTPPVQTAATPSQLPPAITKKLNLDVQSFLDEMEA